MMDLLMDVLGCAIAGLISVWVIRSRPLRQIREKMKWEGQQER